MKYKTGDRVEVNGNKEARILNCFVDNMYKVRLWSKFRYIGDVVVDESDIKLIKESEGKRWPYIQKNMNLLNGVN